MVADVTVRPATEADVDGVVALFAEVVSEGRWLGTEGPVDRVEYLEKMRADLAEPEHATRLVAVTGEGVVGQVRVSRSSFGVADLSMFVADGWRGLGVGSALVEAAIAAARQLKLNKPIIAEQWLTVPPLAQACGAACEGVVFGGHKCRAPELLEATDPLKKHCDEYIAAFKQKFPSEPFALFSIYGHDAVRTYAEAASRVLKKGDELTRDSLVKAMETFDGNGFITSHGYIKTGADSHRLTGTWKEAYLNLTVEADGTNVKWVLAPKAQASGAEA